MSSKTNNLAIVGAGQMGRGIAQTALMSGLEVFLFDVSSYQLDLAKDLITKGLEKSFQKGKITASVESLLERLHCVSDMNALSKAEFAVEAATEKQSVKNEIFKQLDQILPSEAVLATNTSSISITELAAQTGRPEKVIGMHFMNPVPIMKLVEGIRGLETSDKTYDATKALAEAMGKTFICSKDFPGFIVNRILMPMINEAVYTLYEGVGTVEEIDQAMKLGTNQPMGPLELADFIGLDTCLYIMQVLHEGLGDSKYRPCPLLKQYVAAKRLGRKTKRGFYQY
jgi:3-hydroxybutyryl-CoA dehydrogenase